ncbi:hypothetical protein PAJ34TS1_37000 [Paenibacillus azoreducens]|uniref:Uncharacterized protein n=1 Tax=Paenibacillus azoreducens TaxID=116718 RepID=A0A919Y6P3_9BACL|nr:hypothetical protein J34TS1_00840 [Paenibacillus azoreducens]
MEADAADPEEVTEESAEVVEKTSLTGRAPAADKEVPPANIAKPAIKTAAERCLIAVEEL